MKRPMSNISPLLSVILCFATFHTNRAMADVDLAITEVKIRHHHGDKTVHPGEDVHLVIGMEDLGDEASTEFSAEVYAGDDLMYSKSYNTVYSLFHIFFEIPGGFAQGEYVLRIEVSCPGDSNPNNNTWEDTDLFITVTPPAADLRLVHVDVTNHPSDLIFFLGEDIEFDCFVRNSGDAASESYTIDFYAGDYLLDSYDRNSLGVDDEHRFSETVSIPDHIPEDRYALRAEITCENDDDHFGGSNSTRATYLYWIAPLTPPDIEVKSISIPQGLYRPGDSMTVQVDSVALDGQLTNWFGINLFASTDRHVSEDDYPIGTTTGVLNPHEADTVEATCRFPDDLPGNTYYIIAQATWQRVDETKHSEDWPDRPIWIGGHPDLTVRAVEGSRGTYLPGDTTTVNSTIQNIGDYVSGDYVITFYASGDATITPDDYRIGQVTGTGVLSGNEQSHSVPCQLPLNTPEGTYAIGAIVTYLQDVGSTNNTGASRTTINVIHPERYVCGRIQYETQGVRPIRYARLDVYEISTTNSTSDHRTLASTHTDHDGCYGIVLPPNPHANRAVYIRVYTEATVGAYPGSTRSICTVRTDGFDTPYYKESPAYAYPHTTSVTINMTAAESRGEFPVYDSVVEGFHQARTLFGADLDELITYWPSSDGKTRYGPNGPALYVARDDRGDRDVIMHGYGHYIADMYGFAQGSTGDGPTHSYYWNEDLRNDPIARSDEEARHLAFSEAWAHLFSVAAQYGDTGYPHAGDALYQDPDASGAQTVTFDLEDGTADRAWPGQYHVNMNTCALWDLFDHHDAPADDNDTLSDTSLTKIWTTLRDYQPHDIIEFWNSWFLHVSPDHTLDTMRLFRNHEMHFKLGQGSTILEGFESGNFDTLDWQSQGDVPWIITSDQRYRNRYSARAGHLTNSQHSTLRLTLTCNDGDMSFSYQVSSERDYDTLTFYIDGSQVGQWSGEHEWDEVSYPITWGEHTFTWTFAKDGSDAGGHDTAWIDEIRIPVIPIP